MKPHPRIRKTVKWGGAVVSVLLMVVWVGSGWYGCLSGYPNRLWIKVYSGYIAIGKIRGDGTAGEAHLDLFPSKIYPYFWKPYAVWDPAYWEVFTPIWALVVFAAVITACAWRLDTLARRRARLNLCPKCSYDRTGLAVTAVCPECGRSPS